MDNTKCKMVFSNRLGKLIVAESTIPELQKLLFDETIMFDGAYVTLKIKESINGLNFLKHKNDREPDPELMKSYFRCFNCFNPE
jgi:hypothetical protein